MDAITETRACDELPKPVLLLDEAGRIAGTGDSDVFGRVNHVPLVDDSPAPPNPPGSTYPFGGYYANQDTILSYVRQPARTSTQRVEVKVKYGSINTSAGGGDVTWVEDGQGRALSPTYSGRRLGQVDTPWLAVPADGLVHVRWRSDGQQENDNYTGVTVAAYEYRRYEAGATPWWVPLRFPGQYADVESGLFENWNRFYDPAVGRYTANDPLLLLPAPSTRAAYPYANGNPLRLKDPAGLKIVVVSAGGGGSVKRAIARAKEDAVIGEYVEELDDPNGPEIVIWDVPGVQAELTTDPVFGDDGKLKSAEIILGDDLRHSAGTPDGWPASKSASIWHELGHASSFLRHGDPGPDTTARNPAYVRNLGEAVMWENRWWMTRGASRARERPGGLLHPSDIRRVHWEEIGWGIQVLPGVDTLGKPIPVGKVVYP